MKIDGKMTSPLTGEVAGENKIGRAGNAAAKDASPAESVNVQVSTLGAQLQEIEAQLLTGEVVDAARVAEIKQAIAEGRLQIRPDVIADRLLEIVRELVRDNPSTKP